MDFALRLGSTAILARLILPEYFGLVMMVTAVTAIADQFRDLGLSTATVQQKEITHAEVSNLFWINAGAGVVIALFVCAISPLLALYYHEPRLTVVTCVLSMNFVWGGLLVQHQALLARVLKLGHSAAVRVLASVLSTILAVLLAWKGFGYWALVWREVVRCALLTLGMWLCFPWVPGLPSKNTDVRGLIRFGFHLSAANILWSIAGGTDRFLLGRFWGATLVAMYRQAYQLLVMPMDQLLAPVYQVTQPGLSMLQTDPPRFRRFYQKIITVSCVATMPLSLFVAAYSTEITRVVLGRKWLDAAPILLVLSFGTFIKQPAGSSWFILIARGRSKQFLNFSYLQTACSVLAMCIGVYWGTIGVATADVGVTYALLFPRLYYAFKDSPVTIGLFFATAARPALASFIMASVLMVLRASVPGLHPLLSLLLGGLAAAVTFPSAWCLMPGGKAEMLEIVGDLRAVLQKKLARKKTSDPVPVTN